MICRWFGSVLLLLNISLVHATEGETLTDEISDEHLKVAYEAVFISRTSRAYNEIVPNLAKRVKSQLAKKYPSLKPHIIKAVDEVSLKLIEKQAELDLKIAKGWAKKFNIQELRDITTFYATPVGSKLARLNTELIAFGLDEARKWGGEIGQEMVGLVQQKLVEQGFDL